MTRRMKVRPLREVAMQTLTMQLGLASPIIRNDKFMCAFSCMFVPFFVRILMFGGIMLINKIVGIENRLLHCLIQKRSNLWKRNRWRDIQMNFCQASLRILCTSAEYVARRWFLRVFGKKKL